MAAQVPWTLISPGPISISAYSVAGQRDSPALPAGRVSPFHSRGKQAKRLSAAIDDDQSKLLEVAQRKSRLVVSAGSALPESKKSRALPCPVKPKL
jgi:hypothetical protein